MECAKTETLRVCVMQTSLLAPFIADFLSRRTYGADGEGGEETREGGEETREGFDPSEIPPADVPEFAVGDEEDGDSEDSKTKRSPSYGNLDEERNVWGSPGGQR
jgi:hypothetical protein